MYPYYYNSIMSRPVRLEKAAKIDIELKLLAVALILCFTSALQHLFLLKWVCRLIFFLVHLKLLQLYNYMKQKNIIQNSADNGKPITKKFMIMGIKCALIFLYHLKSGKTHSLLISSVTSIFTVLETRECVTAINQRYPYLTQTE